MATPEQEALGNKLRHAFQEIAGLWGPNTAEPFDPKRRAFIKNALILAAGAIIAGCESKEPAFFIPKRENPNTLRLNSGEIMLLSQKSTIAWMPAILDKYWGTIVSVCAETNTKEGTSIQPEFIAIIMLIESCFNPNARSWADAQGLGQITLTAVRDLVGHNKIPDENLDRYDEKVSIQLMVAYFALLQTAYGCNGDTSEFQSLLSMAQGYNGGPSCCHIDFNNLPGETQSYYRLFTGLWKERNLPVEESHFAQAFFNVPEIITGLKEAQNSTGIQFISAPATPTPSPYSTLPASSTDEVTDPNSQAVCADGTQSTVWECSKHGGIPVVPPQPIP